MDIQEIFNKVIAAGIYDGYLHPWMCCVLRDARNMQLITKEEYDYAHEEIRTYLGRFCFLSAALSYNELPAEFSYRFAIYSDWENRPTLQQFRR